jgi:hypothetical protein
MRRITLSLVVLVVVGLAASTALAGPHSPTVSLGVGTTLVGHPGGHGVGNGYSSYGYRSYAHSSRYPYGYRSHHSHRHHPRHSYRRGPVIVRPILPPPPPVIYTYPSYYRYPSYYYGPTSGIHYQGRNFGISIGF